MPGDVAVGPDGTIYLTQAERGAVYAYAPLPAPLETPAGAATPTPGPLACRVAGTKDAAPRRVVLGHAVEVSITLRAACPAPPASRAPTCCSSSTAQVRWRPTLIDTAKRWQCASRAPSPPRRIAWAW
ncbi:MAG: hypothetical protein U0470_09425 [Anaerolineae bacterium]